MDPDARDPAMLRANDSLFAQNGTEWHRGEPGDSSDLGGSTSWRTSPCWLLNEISNVMGHW